MRCFVCEERVTTQNLIGSDRNQAAECDTCGEVWIHLRCMNDRDSIEFAMSDFFMCPDCCELSDSEDEQLDIDFETAQYLLRIGFENLPNRSRAASS
jgi:hypothetical protein